MLEKCPFWTGWNSLISQQIMRPVSHKRAGLQSINQQEMRRFGNLSDVSTRISSKLLASCFWRSDCATSLTSVPSSVGQLFGHLRGRWAHDKIVCRAAVLWSNKKRLGEPSSCNVGQLPREKVGKTPLHWSLSMAFPLLHGKTLWVAGVPRQIHRKWKTEASFLP